MVPSSVVSTSSFPALCSPANLTEEEVAMVASAVLTEAEQMAAVMGVASRID